MGIYLDIDIVNAAPTILGNLARMHKLTCPHVDMYVNNRAEILGKTGWDKLQVIEKIFYHKISEDAPDIFKKMHEEIYSKLVPVLKVKYKKQFENIQKTKKTNINGKFLTHVVFKNEGIIIKSAFDFYKQNNLSLTY